MICNYCKKRITAGDFYLMKMYLVKSRKFDYGFEFMTECPHCKSQMISKELYGNEINLEVEIF